MTEGGAASAAPRHRVILRTTYVVVCLLALAWLASARADTLAGLAGLAPESVLLLLALLLLAHGLAACTTTFLVAWRHADVPVSGVLAAHFRHLPARLLPGGIWHTVGRAGDWSRDGLDRRSIVSVAIAESLLAVTAASLIAMIVLSMGASGWPRFGALALAIAVVVSGVLIAFPRKRRPRLGAGWVLMAAASMGGVWLSIGGAFGVLAAAWPTPTELTTAQAVAHYLLAWAAGHIAFFAPQGIGVTEAVFAFAGQDALGLTLLAAAFRVAMLLGDLIAWLAFTIVSACTTKRSEKVSGARYE